MGVADYRERHRFCEACIVSRNTEAVHHIRSRGAGGTNTDGNLLALCTQHHTIIHAGGWRTFAMMYPQVADKLKAAHEVPR